MCLIGGRPDHFGSLGRPRVIDVGGNDRKQIVSRSAPTLDCFILARVALGLLLPPGKPQGNWNADDYRRQGGGELRPQRIASGATATCEQSHDEDNR